MNTEKLDKLEQQMKAIQAELERVRAECKQEEWPKVGHKYWVFNTHTVWRETYGGDPFDIASVTAGVAFRTEEEAQAAYEWTFGKRAAIRREVELCEGFNPIGDYYISARDGYLEIGRMSFNYAGMSFVTREQAQACIDTVGEDKLRYLLTGEE